MAGEALVQPSKASDGVESKRGSEGCVGLGVIVSVRVWVRVRV